MNKKIVISGFAFPITAAFEYFVRAFKNIGCDVKVVGPYYGNWIPWTKNNVAGMTLPDKYIFEPDIKLPKDTRSCPIGFIENQLGDFVPDIWLDVNAGFYLEGQPKNGIRTTFLTDPHVLRDYYNKIIHNYQYVFNPQNPYRNDNEIFLPYAADNEWNCWANFDNKEYDIVLIGNTYPQRVEFVNELRQQNKRVFFELGIGKMDFMEIYGKSIIGLNWSGMLDLTARAFEVICSGLIPVMNRVPDLPLIFGENINYLGFDSKSEAVEKINLALNDTSLCDRIRENNLKIRNFHLWDRRAEQILNIVYKN